MKEKENDKVRQYQVMIFASSIFTRTRTTGKAKRVAARLAKVFGPENVFICFVPRRDMSRVRVREVKDKGRGGPDPEAGGERACTSLEPAPLRAKA